MDPAKQIEVSALRHQAGMNAALSAGISDVQRYYHGAVVFITGGSGFMGKHLIEKLFRSCEIKKMYLLSRFKKGRTIQERLEYMLKDPVYDTLREKQPRFSDLIEPVQGDVADIRLGLSDEHWNKLANEVNIIFHVAATVRFDEPLRVATLTNVRGTREVLALAKDCKYFKKLVHVSTAFAHATKERIDTEVREQLYPSPVPPDAMIQFAEHVDHARLDNITAHLIENWPNTYTFTKALAEELIRTSAGDVPACIVRPSIVLPAYYEPSPGWLDMATLIGPSGICLGSGLGVIKVFCTDIDSFLPMCPVDYANNAIIAAAWHSDQITSTTHSQIPIYTVRNNLRYGNIGEGLSKHSKEIIPPSVMWKPGVFQIKNRQLYLIVALFLHYIPAYFLDFVCAITGKKPKQISSFVDICKKLDKLSLVYNYFINNEWDFKDDNLQLMMHSMSPEDRAIYNCDISNIDLNEYIKVWAIGLRKYILKDGLKNTHVGVRKVKIFTVLNYIAVTLYVAALWFICRYVYLLVEYILMSFYNFVLFVQVNIPVSFSSI